MSALLYTIASELLDATEDCLEDAGLDPPGRRYVDAGTITAPVEFGDDCSSALSAVAGPFIPSLVTNAVQRRSGNPACALLWDVRFTVAMLRCHPIADALPRPDDIDAEAQLALRDGWQIARGLAYRWSQGDLVPSFSFGCENTQWGQVSSMPPQGGIRGWQFVVTVSVHERYVPVDA